MENAVKISFEGKNAYIDWGQKDISGEYKQSKNGKFFAVCNTLYGKTTSTESVVVFTESDVLYIKKLSEDQDVGHYLVLDDGSCALFTDDYFILVGADGKQVMKKKIPYSYSVWENNSMTACFGSAANDEDGELFIFRYDSREIIRKKVDTIIIKSLDEDGEVEEDYLYGYNMEVKFTGEKFVFVYHDEKHAVSFDTLGNKVEVNDFEVAQIISQKHEREHKQNVDRARQQFEYWIKRRLKAENSGDISDATRSKHKAEDYAKKLELLGEPVPIVQNKEENVSEDPPKTAKALFSKEESNRNQSNIELFGIEKNLMHSSTLKKKKGFLAKLFGKK